MTYQMHDEKHPVLGGVALAEALNAEMGSKESGRFTAKESSTTGAPAILTRGGFVVAVNPGSGGYRIAFWRNGRELANGWTENMASVAGSANLWGDGVGLERLAAAYSFVKFSELQLAYEQGRAKEVQWRTALSEAGSAYRELIDLASRDAVLSLLFPYLGHRLALAKSEDSEGVLASVFVLSPGLFRVYSQDGSQPEFEGDAEAMCTYLSSKLRPIVEAG